MPSGKLWLTLHHSTDAASARRDFNLNEFEKHHRRGSVWLDLEHTDIKSDLFSSISITFSPSVLSTQKKKKFQCSQPHLLCSVFRLWHTNVHSLRVLLSPPAVPASTHCSLVCCREQRHKRPPAGTFTVCCYFPCFLLLIQGCCMNWMDEVFFFCLVEECKKRRWWGCVCGWVADTLSPFKSTALNWNISALISKLCIICFSSLEMCDKTHSNVSSKVRNILHPAFSSTNKS